LPSQNYHLYPCDFDWQATPVAYDCVWTWINLRDETPPASKNLKSAEQ
jgi:hypothetical protein